MIGGQGNLNDGMSGSLEYFLRALALAGAEAQLIHRKAEWPTLPGHIGLDPVMSLDPALCLEPNPFLTALPDDFLYHADGRAPVSHNLGISHLSIAGRLDIQIGPGPAEDGLDILLSLAFGGGGKPVVQKLAVILGHSGDIKGALLAALDLKAEHARVPQLDHIAGQGEILHREGIASAVAAPLPFKGIATGIAAAAPVAAAPAEVGGVEAQSAVGVTQGAMDEGLHIDPAVADNRSDFAQGKFAGERHPAESQPSCRHSARDIMNGHLGAGMHGESREILPCQPRHAQVLDDHGIRTDVRGRAQCLDGFIQLILENQCVQGHKDRAPGGALVCKRRDFAEFPRGEIGGLGPGGKALQAQVNGIRAVVKSRIGGIKVARRRQQFNLHRAGTPLTTNPCASGRSTARSWRCP